MDKGQRPWPRRMNEWLFVTGTDTGVGKTVLSALLCAALDRAYWKPVQTGVVEGTDRATVMRLAGLPEARAFEECYRFDPPVSPHLAAEWCGARIDLGRIERQKPATDGLVIEGAGGALVPLNSTELMVDLMALLKAPVVVATRTTLGTINHTLLTLEALRARRLDVRGVVMLGAGDDDNRRAIELYGGVAVIGHVPPLETIDRASLVRVFNTRFDRTVFGR